MLHLEDVVQQVATGREGKIDGLRSEGPQGAQQHLWRVSFQDGDAPLFDHFKEDDLRLVHCPHEHSESGFVPVRGVME